MEFDILDSLDDLGYPGVLQNDNDVKEAIEKGTKSLEFTQLVEWLSKELQALNDMESCVNALTDSEDSSSFLLEVSSFLKELHCPYKSLMNGPISQRLLDVESRRTLLDYLCTELLTARMLHTKKKVKNALEIEMEDSCTALSLLNAMNTLNIKAEDFSSNPVMCFTEIENKVKGLLDTESQTISSPIITETLNKEQWESLSSLYEDFFSEYMIRRELLLTRLDMTIESFKWGEMSKGKENKILDAFIPLRKKLKVKPSVKLADVIAARESLLVIEKTSSAKNMKNTSSSIKRIIIEAVPDRGGRPKEQRPPVEMPNWMKRNPHGSGRGDHRGAGNFQGKGKKFRGNRGGGGHKGDKRGGSFDAAGSY